MPQLQAFSRSLCRRHGLAEDMAQDALAKAWRSRHLFEPGTNLKAWLFTILRHRYYSHMRRAWREIRWDDDAGEQIPAPADEQMWAMELSDCARALSQLPQQQRDAVLLIGAGGLTYDDAAAILHTPVGSLKSRTSRGRSDMAKYLTGEKPLQPRSRETGAAGLDEILVRFDRLKDDETGNSGRA